MLSGGNASYAMAVNDSGVVVGSSKKTSTASLVPRHNVHGQHWANIGNAVSTTGGTFPTGINDSGQVSLWLRGGFAEDTYIYQSGTYTAIGARPGACNGLPNQGGCDPYQPGSFTFAGAINSSGQIAGVYSATNGNQGDYIWNGSSTVAVTTPGTDNGSDGSTYFSSINNNGVAVGDWQEGTPGHRLLLQRRNDTQHRRRDVSPSSLPATMWWGTTIMPTAPGATPFSIRSAQPALGHRPPQRRRGEHCLRSQQRRHDRRRKLE